MLAAFGLILILLSSGINSASLWASFLSNLGLACAVAGIVSVFHIVVIEQFDRDELAIAIAGQISRQIAALKDSLRLISDARHDCDKYNLWIVNRSADLFMAGRSVLHRIDANLKKDDVDNSIIHHLIRRLREGSSITVLLMDPRSPFIDKVAEEEGHSKTEIFKDIETSLDICKQLKDQLADKVLPGRLSIRVYDNFPYFSYHKHDDMMIVGFYFLSFKGENSPAYEVIDEKTKSLFERHFEKIYINSKPIIENSQKNSRVIWHASLFGELGTFIGRELGR